MRLRPSRCGGSGRPASRKASRLDEAAVLVAGPGQHRVLLIDEQMSVEEAGYGQARQRGGQGAGRRSGFALDDGVPVGVQAHPGGPATAGVGRVTGPSECERGRSAASSQVRHRVRSWSCFFFLDDADKARVARRSDSSRLGFALQLGTVRFLGVFLNDPTQVPADVVE